MTVGDFLANSNTREHGDIITFSDHFGDFVTVSVEAGTNGYQGGDYGHGSRGYVRISGLNEDCGACTPKIVTTENGKVDGIEIEFGGDDELNAMVAAFNFIAKTLKLMNTEMDK